MDAATQKAKILAYCKTNGSITIREAFNLDINSPSKRISEMRLSGKYDVQQVREERVNKAGSVVPYNRYFIAPIPLVTIGDQCRFMPNLFGDGTGLTDRQKEERTVTAEIVSINYAEKTFIAEYKCGPGSQRELFSFSDVGERVSLIG